MASFSGPPLRTKKKMLNKMSQGKCLYNLKALSMWKNKLLRVTTSILLLIKSGRKIV
jgi:hypothetical protein